jgi:hypothetical protein
MSRGREAVGVAHPGYGGIRDLLQFLCGGSLRNWSRLVRENGIDPQFARRATVVSFTSLLQAPFRAAERLRHGRGIRRTVVAPPLFIVGHWRSGTTWLHNLMCQDPSAGFVSGYQMALPDSWLVARRVLRPLIARILPDRRPMDNVTVSLGSPQEEEFVMAKVSPYSCYHFWSFPRQGVDYFRKYALLEGLTDAESAGWRETYLAVLQKTAYGCGGRRLVLKNPVNTARIPALLALFPDARFVHICRDPRDVFPSARESFRRLLSVFQFQRVDDDLIARSVLRFYEQIMGRFFEDRGRIPAGRLSQVRYEDMLEDPMRELRRVYGELSLPGFEAARPRFEAHLASHAGYRRNAYALTADEAREVARRWGFAAEALGYA